MDKWVEELELFTQQLVAQLPSLSFEELEAQVEERGLLIDQIRDMKITSEQREKYKSRVNAIVAHDSVILGRLAELKEAAVSGMQKITTGRLQRTAYDHIQESTDGVFFDQRK